MSDETVIISKEDVLVTVITPDESTIIQAGTQGVQGIQGETGPAGASPLTTKGDLFAFSTLDIRLPIGTDGLVLTADSAEATGLKWAAGGGGGTPGGADTQVQYNNGGAFGGAKLYYDDVNERVGIGVASPDVELETLGTIRAKNSSGVWGNLEAAATNTGFPRAGFSIGSTSGDSLTNAGLRIFPDVTDGVFVPCFLEVDNSPNQGTSGIKRLFLHQDASIARIAAVQNNGNTRGTDLVITTISSSSTNGIFLKSATNPLVGIGETTPAAKLHIDTGVTTTVGQIIKKVATQSADSFQIQDSAGTVEFVVDASGNVGIGDTTPASKLTVAGDIEATGSANGLILESPDGTRYRITMNNGGTTSIAAV